MSKLIANWTAPANVHALTTTRCLGVSQSPYDHNNLALHVGDNESHVFANRAALIKSLALKHAPIWLEQTHSTHCIVVEDEALRHADAAITRSLHVPLSIMTADCLPIVLCNTMGTEIAAIHAGWRGLVNGIIENTLAKMQSHPKTLMAWIGPAICSKCFEIGEEVKHHFTSRYPFTENTFHTHHAHYYADLPKMAELILNAQGIMSVFQSGACTYELENEFYSYRKQPQTGRIATLIWMNEPA